MSYRLIDSNAIAIKYPEVNEMPCVFANLPDGIHGQFIDAQPEIIRCRECKYNDMPPTAGNAGCTLLYGMTNQNGFCSLAERREDKA